MKKILILLLLLIPFTVHAIDEEIPEEEELIEEQIEKEHDIYLIDLKVTGYEITPMFDKFNNIYTLIIQDDITSIEVEYECEDESTIVQIEGSDVLITGENIVLITLRDEEETKENIYEIIVTIEDGNEIVTFNETESNQDNGIGIKEVSGLILGGVVIILIVFRILFIRKKRC